MRKAALAAAAPDSCQASSSTRPLQGAAVLTSSDRGRLALHGADSNLIQKPPAHVVGCSLGGGSGLARPSKHLSVRGDEVRVPGRLHVGGFLVGLVSNSYKRHNVTAQNFAYDRHRHL